MADDEYREQYPMKIRLWESSRFIKIEQNGKQYFIVPEDELEFMLAQTVNAIAQMKKE